jgi:hypothetical protein
MDVYLKPVQRPFFGELDSTRFSDAVVTPSTVIRILFHETRDAVRAVY